MLVFADGTVLGTIGGGETESRVITHAMEAIQTGKSSLHSYTLADPHRGDPGICGGTLEIFVEPIMPEPTVIVIGAGHVGKAVAHLASWVGFRVVVCDDRGEFANPEQAPGGDDYLVVAMEEIPTNFTIHSQTYIVITTRNAEIDVKGLPALLATEAAYIGVIGSRRRWKLTQDKLVEAGIDLGALARVVSPMGLELNAESPEEIALSIMSEIVMLRMGGQGGRMGDRGEA